MLFYLILAFTVGPVLELYLLIQAGRVIGAWETVAIVLVTGVVGANLARLEGLRTLGKIQRTLEAGALPTEELVDGAIILAAGMVLLTPGFITDALGLLMLFPPSRAVFKRWLRRRFENRVQTFGTFQGGGPGFGGGFGGGFGEGFGDAFDPRAGPRAAPRPGGARPERGDVIDVEVIEVERDDGDGSSDGP